MPSGLRVWLDDQPQNLSRWRPDADLPPPPVESYDIFQVCPTTRERRHAGRRGWLTRGATCPLEMSMPVTILWGVV